MGTPQTKDQRKKKGYTDDGWGLMKGQLRGIIVTSSRMLWRIGSHLGELSRGAVYPGHLLAQAEARTSSLTSLLLGLIGDANLSDFLLYDGQPNVFLIT
jgi:hypothetical protein